MPACLLEWLSCLCRSRNVLNPGIHNVAVQARALASERADLLYEDLIATPRQGTPREARKPPSVAGGHYPERTLNVSSSPIK